VGVRGWVYVITNKAMPNLIKVGYSLKDPNLRANDLDNTGSPHPYVVQYEALVYEPLEIEQRVHTTLSDFKEGKEWFNCSLGEAVTAIRKVIGNSAILETIREEIEEQKTQTDKAVNLEPINVEQINSTALRVNRMKNTATYKGICSHCKTSFEVTVLRNEKVTICPTCRGSNDIAAFSRQEFDEKAI